MKYLRLMLAMLTALLLGSNAVLADVPSPNIPKGNAEKCVLPTDEMRVNHMEHILHQRDDTMYEGIRTEQFSFKKCINCHTVKDEAGKAISHKDERHFCNSCHTYAAVKIDCFECHASTPNSRKNVSATGGKDQ